MIHVLQATVTEQHQHRGQVDSTSCILILQFVGLVSLNFVLLEQTKMIASGKFVDWYIFDVLQNPRSYCLSTIALLAFHRYCMHYCIGMRAQHINDLLSWDALDSIGEISLTLP